MMVGLVGQLRSPRRCPRHKQCVGRLSDEERGVWQESITPLKGSSPPWRRAPRLFTTAAEGPAGADGRPAEALHGRGPTSAKRRQPRGAGRLGLGSGGHEPPGTAPPGPRDGEAAAPWLALRLGPPPGRPARGRRAVTRRCVRGNTRLAAADDGGRGEAAGARRRWRGRPGRRPRHLGASLRAALAWGGPGRTAGPGAHGDAGAKRRAAAAGPP